MKLESHILQESINKVKENLIHYPLTVIIILTHQNNCAFGVDSPISVTTRDCHHPNAITGNRTASYLMAVRGQGDYYGKEIRKMRKYQACVQLFI